MFHSRSGFSLPPKDKQLLSLMSSITVFFNMMEIQEKFFAVGATDVIYEIGIKHNKDLIYRIKPSSREKADDLLKEHGYRQTRPPASPTGALKKPSFSRAALARS
jgi:hypothetical protein